MSAKIPARTGQENPATCQEVKFSPSRQKMLGVSMAGSLSRKIPGEVDAGQDVAGEANQVKITKPSLGPVKGWSRLATPALPARSPAESASTFHSTAKQSVKGKHGSAPAEAEQVSGLRV